jgi:hypothetical protein
LRESPETAKFHVALEDAGADDCANAARLNPQSVVSASKPAAIIVRRAIVVVCELLRLKATGDCSFSGW